MKKIIFALIALACFCSYPQQINLPRVEQMPNLPNPYLMRNWKAVARGYDSLVFNFGLTGDYLPLGWIYANTVNYTNHPSFGLDSYVGTNRYHIPEAINIIPAVVGASLAGIDKLNRNGVNWVLYCEEFFNRQNKEQVYLNAPSASSGSDWWYATMPNVFFYQLYDLYRGTGDFAAQFTTVAGRWLAAVEKMGGSAAPWSFPNMDYRGWYLATMTPNAEGTHEPEAAGAIAWLLYNAYKETGNKKFRAGAEWAMEFLKYYYTNPAYELQLSYGVNIAAKMNAELGTGYDVEKLINWTFDKGPLRNWGAITGNWGGYDVSGLIGEISSNDYAFLMNGFQQAAALAPVARYDERFARAIGKWILNLANASRLFYPNYLPDYNQDNRDWPNKYDPSSFIGHEAMRMQGPGNVSPYAAGDAVAGGWAKTNLSLYSSSHAGYLAAIVDTTNVEKILKIDLLKTDFFHDAAYPSFLFFNPYTEAKTITLSVGGGAHDIYNTITKTFIASGVTGNASVTIPADGVVSAVITPAGGTVAYDRNKKLLNGIVIDYRGNSQYAPAPRIKMTAPVKEKVILGDSADVYCTVEANGGNVSNFKWSCNGGIISGAGEKITWKAPSAAGSYLIICDVTASNGTAADTLQIQAVEAPHTVPSINGIKAFPGKLNLGASCDIECSAADSGNSPLSYSWSASGGAISGTGAKVKWRSPAQKENYYIRCAVTNSFGESAADSVGIPVRDLSNNNTGSLVLYMPFSGNTNDESGFGNNGVSYGAVLTADSKGNPNSAFFFNGSDALIQVPNSSSLNMADSITINFQMNIGAFYDREAYPLSHGNWENRWKISVTNNKLRWTVKTDKGVKDLDTRKTLELNKFYNVTAYYDGGDMEIYINGELDNFTSQTGKINKAAYDLTIGQVLPGNKNYNFRGVIDELRIYNYALSVDDIYKLGGGITSVNRDGAKAMPAGAFLAQNFPNPFNPSTLIRYSITEDARVSIKIYDLLGREAAALFDGYERAGEHEIIFNSQKFNLASGVYFYAIRAGGFSAARKLVILR
jgi:hypothetical protein